MRMGVLYDWGGKGVEGVARDVKKAVDGGVDGVDGVDGDGEWVVVDVGGVMVYVVSVGMVDGRREGGGGDRVYVEVGGGVEEPCVVDGGEVGRRVWDAFVGCVDGAMEGGGRRVRGGCRVAEMEIGGEIEVEDVVTLSGIVLGYPVVYVLRGGGGGSNCLGGVPLTVFGVKDVCSFSAPVGVVGVEDVEELFSGCEVEVKIVCLDRVLL